jgi:hypothetical protein
MVCSEPVTHVQSLRFARKLKLHKIDIVLWSMILAQQAPFIIHIDILYYDTDVLQGNGR